MFNLCLNALATYGRLVVIGMISQVWISDSNVSACKCFLTSYTFHCLWIIRLLY